MTRSVVTVTADTPIHVAAELLLKHGFSAVPVVDEQENLVGIVSEADLLRGRATSDPRAHLRPLHGDETAPPKTVQEVMTTEVVALPESADEADFASLMLKNRFKSIPVVENGQVVGIVSASDLLRTHIRSDEEITREIRERLREYASGREAWSVDVNDGVVTLTGDVAEQFTRIAALLAVTVPGVVRVHTTKSEPVVKDEASRPRQDVHGTSSEGPSDHRGLRVLAVDECVRLLREARTGRLAFMEGGDLDILPVNHGIIGLDVVFRTTWGSKLYAAGHLQRVAFEVDGTDEIREIGWSVLVKGTASVVYEDPIIEELEALGISTWARPDSELFWIRIRPDEITGREISSRAPNPS
jgi:CBS domain-containing protein